MTLSKLARPRSVPFRPQVNLLEDKIFPGQAWGWLGSLAAWNSEQILAGGGASASALSAGSVSATDTSRLSIASADEPTSPVLSNPVPTSLVPKLLFGNAPPQNSVSFGASDDTESLASAFPNGSLGTSAEAAGNLGTRASLALSDSTHITSALVSFGSFSAVGDFAGTSLVATSPALSTAAGDISNIAALSALMAASGAPRAAASFSRAEPRTSVSGGSGSGQS